MNWRERIADWISGGELSRLMMQNDSLNHITAREKKNGANATVKRMARIAREAL